MVFKTKIKNLCRANGVTQKQLYESLNISDAGMRKMFARNSCEVSFLEKIATYFRVPLSYMSPDGKVKEWPLFDLGDKQVMVLDLQDIHVAKESDVKIVDWTETRHIS